jgi:uncharacterized protein (TIGR02147 family)
MKKELNVFKYTDHKKFLADWRMLEKEHNQGLTHEYLSTKLGQRNRAYFSDLEKGRRTIGPGLMDRLIKLLTLTGDEAKYFRAIVGYGQWETYEEREYWFEQMVQLNNTPKRFVDKETYLYYKKWYHSTIRTYLETCNFTNEYEKASLNLYGRLTPHEVKTAIETLLSLGLITPDGNGYLKPTEKVLTTGDTVKNELLRQYQLSNHDILRTILEKDESGTHDSTQLTVSVSQEGIERIAKRIKQFRSEIISIAHKDEQHAERVYKIAIHAYPESRKVTA